MARLSLLCVLAFVGCADPGELPGTITLTDSVGAGTGGQGTLSGTIRFPGTIGVDRRISVTLVAQSYATSRSDMVTNGDRVGYVIQGVTDGIYAVGAALDVNGDEVLDEQDWAGFSGGTKDAPVLRRGNARQVPVVAGEGHVDIELGVIGTCLRPLGETCSSDSDCRYAACDCPAHPETGTSERRVFFLPTCPNATNSCTLAGSHDCTQACAPAPAPELSSGPCLRDLDLTSAKAD